jgi:hypothetical protein
MLRRSAVLFAVVGCIAAVGVAGCGSKKSSSSVPGGTPPAASTTTTGGSKTHFAKTKFVLHVGLAGGAFHRWIYKPFKAGVFGKPASHKAALVKAALASLFVYHELKVAAADVKSSKVLSTLFSPITALAAKVSALRSQLAHGKYNPADINAIQAGGGAIAAEANAKGYHAPDIQVNNPAGVGAPTG